MEIIFDQTGNGIKFVNHTGSRFNFLVKPEVD
jgi:hypothetical protein